MSKSWDENVCKDDKHAAVALNKEVVIRYWFGRARCNLRLANKWLRKRYHWCLSNEYLIMD